MDIKNQVILGVVSYGRNEIMPNVTDEHFKFILSAALSALEINPDLANSFFSNELVSVAMTDLTTLEKILTKTIQECGSYTLTIPAIKFVLPDEQMLTFTSQDVSTLFKYIRSVS